MLSGFVAGMMLLGTGNLFVLFAVLVSDALLFPKLLSVVFIFQCTWRCFFVSDYIFQKTTTSFFLNSVLLARMLAFVGESCFVFQISWFFLSTPHPFPKNDFIMTIFLFVACNLFNLCAQCCATYATITKQMKFFVIEGVLWMLIFIAFAMWSFIICVYWWNSIDELHFFFVASAIGFSLASIYMQKIYVPTTVRDMIHLSSEFDYVNSDSFCNNVKVCAFVKVVNHDVKAWKDEIFWQVPYFAIGPLVSSHFSFMF